MPRGMHQFVGAGTGLVALMILSGFSERRGWF
jgi:hypothetical protein